jgi:Flp pilus assembly protein TadG
MRVKFASQKGAAMVEFALILIPLIILTFGLIEFGLLMYNQQVLTNASREGARAGIVVSNPRLLDTGSCTLAPDGSILPTSIKCVVDNYCLNHLVTFDGGNSPTTEVSGYAYNAAFGTNLRVKVSFDYSFLVVPNFIPGITNPRTMEAVTVMKYE